MNIRTMKRIRAARARGATLAELCDIFQTTLAEIRKALVRV